MPSCLIKLYQFDGHLNLASNRAASSVAAERKYMGYPTDRDRIVEYVAKWEEVPSKDGFNLGQLTITFDRIDRNQRIHLEAVIDTPLTEEPAAQKAERLKSKLTQLNLRAGGHWITLHGRDTARQSLALYRLPRLEFGSPHEVVHYINQFGSLFDRLPVQARNLSKRTISRDVRVLLSNSEVGWRNEVEWLVELAPEFSRKLMEDKVTAACRALRENGQGIRVTLASTLTVEAAQLILDTYGTSFDFSSEARNALRMVGQQGYEPQPLTITFEYLTPLNFCIQRIARLLAPWAQNVEFVTAE